MYCSEVASILELQRMSVCYGVMAENSLGVRQDGDAAAEFDGFLADSGRCCTFAAIEIATGRRASRRSLLIDGTDDGHQRRRLNFDDTCFLCEKGLPCPLRRRLKTAVSCGKVGSMLSSAALAVPKTLSEQRLIAVSHEVMRRPRRPPSGARSERCWWPICGRRS